MVQKRFALSTVGGDTVAAELRFGRGVRITNWTEQEQDSMRNLGLIALGLLVWQNVAPAQTNNSDPSAADRAATGVVGANGAVAVKEYTPLTASERWKNYLIGAFGPEALLRAAAGAGIRQWEGSPKEWGGGALAYGERVGNGYAEHIIRKTLESGAAAALHEDNRYFRSTDTGVWKRTRHAVTSVFVARNEAGQEHFAYTRFGSTLGAAFISRLWQPPSQDSSGNAMSSFGITIAADMGFNVVREFWPNRYRRHQP
jgi:hypothetical protein